MRGLYLILTVMSLILILFGTIFAILYAFENEKKKEDSPGTYWGLVIGLGIGSALVGIIMFIVIIYLSKRQIVKAEISIERLEAQLGSIKGGIAKGGITTGYDYLTLDNGEVIKVYNQNKRDSELAAKIEETKRKVLKNRQDSTTSRVSTSISTPGETRLVKYTSDSQKYDLQSSTL